MVFLFRLEIMPFKVSEMIIAIPFLTCQQGNEQLVLEMFAHIFLVVVPLTDRVERIAQPEFTVGDIPGEGGGIIDASSAVAAHVHDQVPDTVFLQCAEGVFEKLLKTISATKRPEVHHRRFGSRINFQQPNLVLPQPSSFFL